LLPNPLWLLVQQLPYFSPWYDPSKEGSTQLAQDYLNQSPAAMAAGAIAANMKVPA